MGVKTIVSCDSCGNEIKDEDYITIELKYELDHNYHPPFVDEHKREFGVFCQEHGKKIWEKLVTEVS